MTRSNKTPEETPMITVDADWDKELHLCCNGRAQECRDLDELLPYPTTIEVIVAAAAKHEATHATAVPPREDQDGADG